jgi:aldose 1-epimerase
MSFSATEFGCTITSIKLLNKKGVFDDIVLGYSTLDDYVRSPNLCFGSLVGRFANRIGGGTVKIGKKKYELDKNDNSRNCLHGGFNGYSKMVWKGEPIETKHEAGVRFSRLSPDSEQGFPGNLQITVTYLLDDDNNLKLTYIAKTDKETPVNITNHSYFNLAGKGSAHDHKIQLLCDYNLEKDDYLIPTGKFCKTAGTPYDFRNISELGKSLEKMKPGYDDCYVTNVYDPELKNLNSTVHAEKIVRAAVVKEETSGRTMTVDTNQEGIQFYTANWIEGVIGKNGTVYHSHDGICLETQCFPDSPNKKDFPSCILTPDAEYKAVTIYGFSF